MDIGHVSTKDTKTKINIKAKREPKTEEPQEISDKEYWQQERQKVIRDLLLFFVALIIVAIGVGTAAWFASNKEVSGNNMVVAPQDGMFELRVEDVASDNVGADVYGKAAEGNYASGLKDGALSAGAYETNGENTAIKWRLTGAYDGKSLEPGTEGKLTFYVVPKTDGALSIRFKIYTKGYTADQTEENGIYTVNSIAEISNANGATADQIAAAGYLNGHILFFEHRETVTLNGKDVYNYKDLCDTEGFTVDIGALAGGSVIKGEPVKVDLYWIWPNTFGQMVLSAADNGGLTSVTTDENTLSDIRDYAITQAGSIFKGVGSEPRAKMATAQTTDQGMVYTFDLAVLKSSSVGGSNYEELSLGYNRADQAIGTGVDYALIILTAEPE